MKYVFVVIWLGFVLKAIVSAMRSGKNQSRHEAPSGQVPSTVISYRGQTIVLPKFVARQDAFIKEHLVDEYQKMVDFYFMKFTNGGEGDYVLTLQVHRTLAVGGIDDGLIAELREDARNTAAELVANGVEPDDDSAGGDDFEINVGDYTEADISVVDDAYAPDGISKDAHAGESYAAPIPPPHKSPMAGTKMSSEVHADSHVAPVNVKDTLPEHGQSMAAKHADSHIATTEAENTPLTPEHFNEHRSPFASIIPHGEKELQKAMVLKEILGEPKGLQ